jgi:hypothetical protein
MNTDSNFRFGFFVMLSAAKASVFYLKNSFCLAFSHIQMLSLRSA